MYLETRVLVLIGAMMGAAPVHAGPSPEAPSAAAAAGPAAASAPSPDVMKRAKLAGYRLRKLRNGTTVFCKQEAHVGSRFSTDSCIDEPQLEELLLRVQSQRDAMKNRVGAQTDIK